MPSSIESTIDEYFREGQRVPQTQEVLRILKHLVEENLDSATLIVDGLDEAKEDDYRIITHCLKQLLQVDKTIKLLISSRDDDMLIDIPSKVNKGRLKVLPTTISTDIVSFIKHSAICWLMAD